MSLVINFDTNIATLVLPHISYIWDMFETKKINAVARITYQKLLGFEVQISDEKQILKDLSKSSTWIPCPECLSDYYQGRVAFDEILFLSPSSECINHTKNANCSSVIIWKPITY